jgi:hypothetical protein
LTPDQRRANLFERCFKQRIFISDRTEKVEKVLVNLFLIHKDITYCSEEDLIIFK